MTTKIKLTSSWLEIASGQALIEKVSSNIVCIAYGVSEPLNKENCHMLQNTELNVFPLSSTSEKVYACSYTDEDAYVVVTGL